MRQFSVENSFHYFKLKFLVDIKRNYCHHASVLSCSRTASVRFFCCNLQVSLIIIICTHHFCYLYCLVICHISLCIQFKLHKSWRLRDTWLTYIKCALQFLGNCKNSNYYNEFEDFLEFILAVPKNVNNITKVRDVIVICIMRVLQFQYRLEFSLCILVLILSD